MSQFQAYLKAEWCNVGSDANGLYVTSDPNWTMKTMRKEGWDVSLTGEKSMEAGDGFRFYFTLN